MLTTYFILFVINVAAAHGASPIATTEKGSSTLTWLVKHPRPGTPRSRMNLARSSRRRVWNGLRLAGVYHPFMCIHRHESIDWHIHNPPYDGGMQEDQGFQATYGWMYFLLWGNASHWPPWAQVMAAYRAYHGGIFNGRKVAARGYSPWSTAGACGL